MPPQEALSGINTTLRHLNGSDVRLVVPGVISPDTNATIEGAGLPYTDAYDPAGAPGSWCGDNAVPLPPLAPGAPRGDWIVQLNITFPERRRLNSTERARLGTAFGRRGRSRRRRRQRRRRQQQQQQQQEEEGEEEEQQRQDCANSQGRKQGSGGKHTLLEEEASHMCGHGGATNISSSRHGESHEPPDDTETKEGSTASTRNQTMRSAPTGPA